MADFRAFLHGRNPQMVAVAQFFREEIAPPGVERTITREFAKLVYAVCRDMPDSAELTNAMRKLVEARDGVIRAAVLDLYAEDD